MKKFATCLFFVILPLAAQEVPKNRIFFPVAWCKDFTIGARGVEKKTEDVEGYELWMHVPELGAKEYRIAATPFSEGKGSTLGASCYPDNGLVSPDAQWVAFSQKYCTHYSVAFLLGRDEKAGFKPLGKAVSQIGWDLFFEQNPDQAAKRGEMDGITDLSGSSLCDALAWEPDSSGVWFSLRGGNRRKEGIYHWYFFWDAESGQVSVPERVKRINRFAAKRWGSDGKELDAEFQAEEEDHWMFLAELEERIEHPDRDVDKESLKLLARGLFYPVKGKVNDVEGKPSEAIGVPDIIDKQREDLTRASQRMGNAAAAE